MSASPRPGLKGTMPWTKQGFEFTTPAKLQKRPYFRVGLRYARGTVWYDGVQLREVGGRTRPARQSLILGAQFSRPRAASRPG